MRISLRHAHHVGHERERCELVGERPTEEPQISIGWVCIGEIVEYDPVGNELVLDGDKGLETNSICLLQRLLKAC